MDVCKATAADAAAETRYRHELNELCSLYVETIRVASTIPPGPRRRVALEAAEVLRSEIRCGPRRLIRGGA